MKKGTADGLGCSFFHSKTCCHAFVKRSAISCAISAAASGIQPKRAAIEPERGMISAPTSAPAKKKRRVKVYKSAFTFFFVSCSVQKSHQAVTACFVLF